MSRVQGRLALVSAVAISVSLLTACDGKSSGDDAAMTEMAAFMRQSMPTTPPDLLKAACEEGKLDILYNNVKNLSQYTDQFKKHFPCLDVSAVANGDDDNLAKFLASEK